jgi:hypothetical protein
MADFSVSAAAANVTPMLQKRKKRQMHMGPAPMPAYIMTTPGRDIGLIVFYQQ